MNQPDSERTKNEDVVPKDVVVRPQRRRSTGSSDSESDTELAELQKHVARRTAEFDPAASATAQTSNGQQVTLRQTLFIIVGCWLLLILCPPLPLVLGFSPFVHNKYGIEITFLFKSGSATFLPHSAKHRLQNHFACQAISIKFLSNYKQGCYTTWKIWKSQGIGKLAR